MVAENQQPDTPEEFVKVLIVEDDESHRLLYRDAFVEAGFTVLVAETKESAVAKITTERPDLVLLDYTLPDGNGGEVLAELRADDTPWTQQMSIYMLTQHDDADKIAEAVTNGADGYFVKKDVTPEEVITEVRRQKSE